MIGNAISYKVKNYIRQNTLYSKSFKYYRGFAELRAPQVKHTLPLKFLLLQFVLCPPLQPVAPHLEHL